MEVSEQEVRGWLEQPGVLDLIDNEWLNTSNVGSFIEFATEVYIDAIKFGGYKLYDIVEKTYEND